VGVEQFVLDQDDKIDKVTNPGILTVTDLYFPVSLSSSPTIRCLARISSSEVERVFHKLWLDRPWRYSEDLDYVRRSDGGVGDMRYAK
jgi:hypothetical protein